MGNVEVCWICRIAKESGKRFPARIDERPDLFCQEIFSGRKIFRVKEKTGKIIGMKVLHAKKSWSEKENAGNVLGRNPECRKRSGTKGILCEKRLSGLTE